ncbi:Sec-independent protein translocase protein TatB [Xanthomonas albilineans]|uniref:Sec-independent protein translocase protein TatB n=1 Tax=Xanthomonas albilineans TaxID=29447 RepID=UPI0005F34282|nr:Sec-independent protein translocase protein TatB [Xanthomonas albilineans]
MFDIGFSELLVIAVVALVVLGPERLPKAARFAGLWVRRARAQWDSVKQELERELEAEELKRSLRDVQASLRQAETQLRDSGQQLQRETDALRREIDPTTPNPDPSTGIADPPLHTALAAATVETVETALPVSRSAVEPQPQPAAPVSSGAQGLTAHPKTADTPLSPPVQPPSADPTAPR